ncbi:NADPH-dependent FMN reductase [Serratia sp. D1N4]
MNIAIVTGSHRKQSNSRNVANYIAHQLQQKNHFVDTIDLAEINLPLWDEDVETNEQKWSVLKECHERLSNVEALIIVTPEWNGMAPPMLKNFLLLCEAEYVGHKPALLVSVSSGMGGAYPIHELRSSGYKNNHICYLPDHIIVRYANNTLRTPLPADDHEQLLRSRIDYQLNLLLHYGAALSQVRASGIVDFEQFRYGM